jgi:hypothetical protein
MEFLLPEDFSINKNQFYFLHQYLRDILSITFSASLYHPDHLENHTLFRTVVLPCAEEHKAMCILLWSNTPSC